jgi:hypothetical protein
MTTTNNITIVSPTTGSIVPEWVTVEVKITDAPLRHNLQLFVYSADGKFYPQRLPVYDAKRDVYVIQCRVGFTVPNAQSYTIVAISNKRVWNIDAVIDDDTFASIPVIVTRQ